MSRSPTISRRDLLAGGVALVAAGCGAPSADATRPVPAGAGAAPPPFALDEATIGDLQRAMERGERTSRSICEAYLARIADLDRAGPTLRALVEVNPDALAIAGALDAERRTKGPRGPLHGIPVLLKDNVATGDRMPTTAGSLALAGVRSPRDAAIVKRLRDAGAVVLGKTNLSEWANIRSSSASSGWSGRAGQCKNPYVLDRSPCGSSSGSGAAIAANLAAVAVGTETDGSIVCPSAACALVGLKPTLGLVSRTGIVPIAHSQDTAGPMARTVRDAALLLSALAGADPEDAATGGAPPPVDYARALEAGAAAMKGARIGVARKKLFGYHAATDALVEAELRVLEKLGAVLVDPADIPHLGEYDDDELSVLLYELKADLPQYLAKFAPGAPIKTLEDVIAFDERHRDAEMPFFGQELFLKAQAKGPLGDAAYVEALAKCRRLARDEGLAALFAEQRLDALVAPTGSPTWAIDLVLGDHFVGASSTAPAVAGFPHVTVPAGTVAELPVGLSFIGAPFSEAKLLALAYAYEQATKHRRPPRFLRSAIDLAAR